MPQPTFARVSVEQFADLLDTFPFTRRINAVHMHHTWRPRRSDFRGHDTVVGMWRHHTQVNGWSDIAQHVTIDPQGFIWLGRNWNLPPASASGNNGNRGIGPFMFEMVGDFDRGREPFDGPQREAALRVVALVQRRFGLPATSLRFHNMMSAKSCPGGALDYDETLEAVSRIREALEAERGAPGAPRALPFPDEARDALQHLVRGLTRVTDNTGEPGDAEPGEGREAYPAYPASPVGEGGAGIGIEGGVEGGRDGAGPGGPRAADGLARGEALDPATLAALRPHLVNLRAGRFSAEGEFSSTPQDVDAIFEQHLEAEVAALPPGGRLRLLFFAHGGLVSERSGLAIARKHVDWWKRNGVYPVYFLWETGFFETLGQLLDRARQGTRAVTRDLADFTTDPLIEITARALQGPRIWGGMKWSAQRAADKGASPPEEGGAHYVARRLKAFCDKHGERVELHAAGHSAGSIFHSHFLPVAQSLGVPALRTLHFLAPALRVDAFRQRLLPGLRNGSLAAHLTVYTMQRDFERADHCAHVYRKSLLYLVHHALEDAARTPILGLEESLRRDAEAKAFFGLDGSPAPRGEVVWSVSAADGGRSASAATEHGGFDDDPLTLDSMARRVLDKQDADPIVPYAPLGSSTRGWLDEVDWPFPFAFGGWPPRPPAVPPLAPPVPAAGQVPIPVPAPAPALAPAPVTVPPAVPTTSMPGRRLALCIGIDAYPDPQHRLSGCVNDARAWQGALGGLGFEVQVLADRQATRAAIEAQLRALVAGSRPGDVLVLQYSGHGTRVTDLDADETDGSDEALCPVDFASGALFIDDDLAQVLALLPDAVNLTVFMDCCHSGTNTRFAVGLDPGATALPPDSKARFVHASADILEAHRQFRLRQVGGARSAAPPGGSGGPQHMRHVKFSACLDEQVALESGGNGEFTRRATRVLGRGIGGVTHEGFLRAVLGEFGTGARQQPMLDCAPAARAHYLLQPLPQPLHPPLLQP